LTAYQLAQLRKLVKEAWQYSPYYREVLDERLLRAIDQARTPEEALAHIPILEKSTLRSYGHAVRSRNKLRRAVVRVATSGTTGTPVEVCYDPYSLQFGFALWRRFHDWMGLPSNFRNVRFSGRRIVESHRRRPPFWVHNLSGRQLLMATDLMTPDRLPHYVTQLNRFAPQLLDGYPSALYVLARHIIENQIRLTFTPVAIATTAETLEPAQRQAMEEAFQCKVYNQYASSEGAPVITECPQGRLHLIPESGIFEFLDPQGKPARPGSIGEMVVTSFCNWKVPLLRYRIGDMVRLPSEDEACPCGREFSWVADILGREEDLLVTSSGGIIGMVSYRVFKRARHIRSAQIIQETPSRLRLRIVREPGYGPDIEVYLTREFAALFGPETTLIFEYVEHIPLTPNRKFRAALRCFPLEGFAGPQPQGLEAPLWRETPF
jgi:phenylacetate-CoA ligase